MREQHGAERRRYASGTVRKGQLGAETRAALCATAARAARRRAAQRHGQLGAERRQLPQQRGSLSRDLEFFVGWDHEHLDGSAVR
jgi:hypothetical protein